MNPSEGELCYTFENLLDGQEYCYWVKGIDDQQNVVYSDTVSSIQDNTKPVINGFVFPGGDTLNDQIWAYARNIDLNLIAHDTPPVKYGIMKFLRVVRPVCL